MNIDKILCGTILNSCWYRERQQQLEELTKELGRIQDEADTLRIKLRQYKANKVGINKNTIFEGLMEDLLMSNKLPC